MTSYAFSPPRTAWVSTWSVASAQSTNAPSSQATDGFPSSIACCALYTKHSTWWICSPDARRASGGCERRRIGLDRCRENQRGRPRGVMEYALERRLQVPEPGAIRVHRGV